jgi:hypothetical protein
MSAMHGMGVEKCEKVVRKQYPMLVALADFSKKSLPGYMDLLPVLFPFPYAVVSVFATINQLSQILFSLNSINYYLY